MSIKERYNWSTKCKALISAGADPKTILPFNESIRVHSDCVSKLDCIRTLEAPASGCALWDVICIVANDTFEEICEFLGIIDLDCKVIVAYNRDNHTAVSDVYSTSQNLFALYWGGFSVGITVDYDTENYECDMYCISLFGNTPSKVFLDADAVFEKIKYHLAQLSHPTSTGLENDTLL